MLQMNSYK